MSVARLATLGAALTIACGRPPPTRYDAAPPRDQPVDTAVRSQSLSIAVPRETAATPQGWVDIAELIPDAVIDLRYATANNLTGAPLYDPTARCLLRREVGLRLVRAAEALRAQGLRLLMWDCYRPASAQAELWRRKPNSRFVAQPRFDKAGVPTSGSRHSRGAAVDVAVVSALGAHLPLPTDHDDFSPAASSERARSGNGAAATNARALAAAMAGAGFISIASEWWHFDDPDAMDWPLSDIPFT